MAGGVDDAVVEHAARRGNRGRRAEAELGDLAQPLLAVLDQHLRQRKGAAARLGDQAPTLMRQVPDQLVLTVSSVLMKSS